MTLQSPTRYAHSGEVSVAYQVVGQGPVDLVVVPGLYSHLELGWDDPLERRFRQSLASFSRLILFDKRGTGLSDPTEGPATIEERMDDVRAVMEAAHSSRAHILGWSEGAAISIAFAATHPERVASLTVWGGWARLLHDVGYEIGLSPEQMQATLDLGRDHWGEGRFVEILAPSQAGNQEVVERWARYERAALNPRMARVLWQFTGSIDIRSILPSVRVPTLVLHRRRDRAVPVSCGRYLAEHIPGASYRELEGKDHIMWIGDQDQVLSEIKEFVTGTREEAGSSRVLATLLFADLVGSTKAARKMGDAPWASALAACLDAIHRQIKRFGGVEVDRAGDGVFAVFDRPTQAIRCAQAVQEAVRSAGLEVRIGIHTGECERMDGGYKGISVHTAARVCALATTGEILVSRTVRDLVAGSGLAFEGRGVHELKDVPGEWELHAVVQAS
ncbi:MAG: adenylate/guanylate cyclase domain-containing protein [Candidatus Dormibacteraceae bacterium]